MNIIKNISRSTLNKTRSIIQLILLSYPKKVKCNICKWEGRHFLSDSWHDRINCPKCHSGIRQRLFVAALQNIEDFLFDRIIQNKNILHFAPEEIISLTIRKKAKKHITADFLRQDCDLKLDISNMPEVKNNSYDVVIAFDVLEHVPDYQKAIEEIHRVLSSKGFGIFTVPQKDHLLTTYEDKSIVTPEDRAKYFGQWDHLRIFGDDFTDIVCFNYEEEEKGEIYISMERVKENAVMYAQTIENELHRVIIHGILHLVGYNDKEKEEKALMTKKEDRYLRLM